MTARTLEYTFLAQRASRCCLLIPLPFILRLSTISQSQCLKREATSTTYLQSHWRLPELLQAQWEKLKQPSNFLDQAAKQHPKVRWQARTAYRREQQQIRQPPRSCLPRKPLRHAKLRRPMLHPRPRNVHPLRPQTPMSTKTLTLAKPQQRNNHTSRKPLADGTPQRTK